MPASLPPSLLLLPLLLPAAACELQRDAQKGGATQRRPPASLGLQRRCPRPACTFFRPAAPWSALSPRLSSALPLPFCSFSPAPIRLSVWCPAAALRWPPSPPVHSRLCRRLRKRPRKWPLEPGRSRKEEPSARRGRPPGCRRRCLSQRSDCGSASVPGDAAVRGAALGGPPATPSASQGGSRSRVTALSITAGEEAEHRATNNGPLTCSSLGAFPCGAAAAPWPIASTFAQPQLSSCPLCHCHPLCHARHTHEGRRSLRCLGCVVQTAAASAERTESEGQLPTALCACDERRASHPRGDRPGLRSLGRSAPCTGKRCAARSRDADSGFLVTRSRSATPSKPTGERADDHSTAVRSVPFHFWPPSRPGANRGVCGVAAARDDGGTGLPHRCWTRRPGPPFPLSAHAD